MWKFNEDWLQHEKQVCEPASENSQKKLWQLILSFNVAYISEKMVILIYFHLSIIQWVIFYKIN